MTPVTCLLEGSGGECLPSVLSGAEGGIERAQKCPGTVRHEEHGTC